MAHFNQSKLISIRAFGLP